MRPLGKGSMHRHTNKKRTKKLSHICNGYIEVSKKSSEWEVMKKRI